MDGSHHATYREHPNSESNIALLFANIGLPCGGGDGAAFFSVDYSGSLTFFSDFAEMLQKTVMTIPLLFVKDRVVFDAAVTASYPDRGTVVAFWAGVDRRSRNGEIAKAADVTERSKSPLVRS